MRYTASPSEVSLVDLPCLPGATFDVVKADGMTEKRPFVKVEAPAEPQISNDEVAARATELAKAAGDETKWADHIEAARTELVAKAAEQVADQGSKETAPVTPAAVEKGTVTPNNPSDEEEQVWKSKRDGATFKTKAELRKYHEDLDAKAAADAAAAPVMSKLKEINDALAKKDFSDDKRKEMAAKGEAMPDGSFPIADRSDLENAVHDYGRAKNKGAAKRHIIKRAKALDATDLLPPDWPGSTQGKDATKSAETGDLKKGASLWSVSNLMQTLAQVESAEECAEYNDPWCGVMVPKALTDRFGAVLTELGDVTAELLDLVLESMRNEEAQEAMEMAAPITNMMKLAKAGARHSKADSAAIQAAHDYIVKAGADCAHDKAAAADDLAKRADELAKVTGERDTAQAELSKVTAERDAFQKAVGGMADQLGEVLDRVKKIEAQPMPMPLTRVVDKVSDGGRSASGDINPEAIIAQLVEKMGPDAISTILIKQAQQNGKPLFAR